MEHYSTTYREQLEKLVSERTFIKDTMKEIDKQLDVLNDQLNAHIEAREAIQKAAQLTQNYLESRLTKIVSQAMEIVFYDEQLGFAARFITKRNSTECEMFITEDGEEYHPMGSCGFGAADVAAFALRIAMWSLNKTAPVMIFDEPFRNLDEWRMPDAAVMLETLSQELGIQMIVVTHKEDLAAHANRVFKVTKNGKVSTVERVSKSH